MFVAVVAAGVRVELIRALPVAVVGVFALALSLLIYDLSGIGLLAYALGISAALLAASNARQTVVRAEQAELLLAQTQRSHEEQLRAARLQESTRIARDIHDVLAHTLAGLTIQLEATGSLIEQGADRDACSRACVDATSSPARACGRPAARSGRCAGSAPPAAGIEALVADYRTTTDALVQLDDRRRP